MNAFTANDDLTVTIDIANPAAGNKAIIYVGETAQLNFTMNNATGGDITVQSGDTAATLEIFMPSFFTSDEVSTMTISDISQPGWSWKYYETDETLLLTFTGTSNYTWANGANLTFTIGNVVSTAAPAMQDVVIGINNITGDNVPAQPGKGLALNQPVVPGNADITKVIDVGLDNQGTVFISVEQDPLSNTLTLNFKNITNNPLYNDPVMWKNLNPTVTVTFVYGTTQGSLAPDQKEDSTVPGSAWLISVKADAKQNWGYANNTNIKQANSPSWTMFPNSNNKDIIGVGDAANVSFQFVNIDSFTPAGHTQMYVQFAGFPATSSQMYDTAIFVVDIVKVPPPPTRGLISFFSSLKTPIITLSTPTFNIPLPLKWYMYYVDNITLICNLPGIAPITENYYSDSQPFVPLNNSSATVTLPMLVTQPTSVMFTLLAYDRQQNFLNALQFNLFINANFFADPMGQVYPTVMMLNNTQTWLAANYNYNSLAGSTPYAHNGGNQTQYGLLYTFQAAFANVPPGWRIPTQADWQALIDEYGNNAYAALTPNGSANFNAQLGGDADSSQNFNFLGQTGYYWANTPDPANPGKYFVCTFFGGTLQRVNVLGSLPTNYYASVRYVKNT
jgi:uncharacterized protein (TIGR02145 family)